MHLPYYACGQALLAAATGPAPEPTLATQGELMKMLGERRSRWMMGGEWLCSAAMPLAVPHSCKAGCRQ